ncbi:MAG TPA: class I SAM-dependent methyltransferase [Candidatus Dormibacteraeota bacterium]|nr:class I SAM-dependent methyltransferase [Candidatus Dormibacteraeota bacterium]
MSFRDAYRNVYGAFDSELAQKLRHEAHGEDDVGQQSWVMVSELRESMSLLRLSAHSSILDLGCGAAGPLTFMVESAGCRGVGIDVSPAAIQSGRARAEALGVAGQVSLEQADLNSELSFDNHSFDAAISIDVVLHVRDRAQLFGEVARILTPAGRFWLTDAAVLVGPISNQDVSVRFPLGYSNIVPAGFNERALEAAGMQVVAVDDRTPALIARARARLAARIAHREEVELAEGHDGFEAQGAYLEAVAALAERGALARFSYIAEKPA